MDAIFILRATYLALALGVLFVAVTPPLRDRFLAYGPRAAPASALPPTPTSKPTSPPTRSEKKKAAAQERKGGLAKRDVTSAKEVVTGASPSDGTSKLLDIFATWKVSHSLFWSFYLFSTMLSLFWLVQAYFNKGSYYRAIASRIAPRTTYMTFEQLKLTWILFSLKNAWRFNEYMAQPPSATKSGKAVSKIWIGHWLLGMLFYTLTNIAIWIEGVPTLENHNPSKADLSFSVPSLRVIISVLIFIFASGLQSDAHSYLARLKYMKPNQEGREDEHGYKVPVHPAFSTLIAPHYTAECAMWLSIALIAAPEPHPINFTLLCALIFVIVNLGVTARGTRQWYEDRFGPDAVKNKWNLIPSIY